MEVFLAQALCPYVQEILERQKLEIHKLQSSNFESNQDTPVEDLEAELEQKDAALLLAQVSTHQATVMYLLHATYSVVLIQHVHRTFIEWNAHLAHSAYCVF